MCSKKQPATGRSAARLNMFIVKLKMRDEKRDVWHDVKRAPEGQKEHFSLFTSSKNKNNNNNNNNNDLLL